MEMICAKNGSLNFIDDNNVVLGVDSSPQCCEDFWISILDYEPTSAIYEDSTNYEDVDLSLEFFDETYIKHLESSDSDWYVEHAVVFKLIGERELYLVLNNHHNGYYSHGFEFKSNDTTIENGYV